MLTNKAMEELIPYLKNRQMRLHDGIEFLNERLGESFTYTDLHTQYDRKTELCGRLEEVNELVAWLHQ